MSSPTSSATASLPSDYSTPLAVVDANDHGAWVIICNAFGLCIILICLGIRVYIRTKVSPPFGYDDHLLTISTIFAIIQVSIVFAQIHEGFGKSIDLLSQSSIVQIQKYAYVAQIFLLIVVYVAKCSIVMLFQRISPDRRHLMSVWAVLSVCITFFVISVFLVALRCDVSQPWIVYGQSCGTLIGQWKAVAAFDIISEVLLFFMSIQLVWDLQTPMVRKARVVFAFAMRLPLIAIAAITLTYRIDQIDSTNPTLTGAITAVLTQLEVFFAIMATTIPCLRPFLAGFITNFGAMGGETVMGGSQIGNSKEKSGSKSNSGNGSRAGIGSESKGSFAMASLASAGEQDPANTNAGKKRKGKSRSQDRSAMAASFRPDLTNHEAHISRVPTRTDASGAGATGATTADNSSISSHDSQRMIIRKEVEWQVESDGSRNPSRVGHSGLG
ncbi:hypothetical protein K431DRAFT_300604 [Polychaeton citri CBS 116435]|uniref:Rhodopsin domain-containing protein n=1 Tax=Polychaeton citri CBS 116435 TaxID=1314669 RepID=A0A9P4UTH0_9PEZI|nr:hypothetical protein K431DRAFT_300604 [Polychaeton citri CBS 116435]